MSSLADLLAKPSVESWKAIVEIGKKARRILRESEGKTGLASVYAHGPHRCSRLAPDRRVCPARMAKGVQRSRRTSGARDGHLQPLPRQNLRASRPPPVRRFPSRLAGAPLHRRRGARIHGTGALRLLTAALAASSTMGMTARVKRAINLLASGVRNVGKVGCADLTGGLWWSKHCACGILWYGNGACPDGECENQVSTCTSRVPPRSRDQKWATSPSGLSRSCAHAQCPRPWGLLRPRPQRRGCRDPDQRLSSEGIDR